MRFVFAGHSRAGVSSLACLASFPVVYGIHRLCQLGGTAGQTWWLLRYRQLLRWIKYFQVKTFCSVLVILFLCVVAKCRDLLVVFLTISVATALWKFQHTWLRATVSNILIETTDGMGVASWELAFAEGIRVWFLICQSVPHCFCHDAISTQLNDFN